MPATLDLAAPKLGSGARFKKLSATLAARGVSDPDALAAHIGRKKYGPKKFAGLAHAHANPDLGIYLAETVKDDEGKTLTCPECGHIGPPGDFGVSGAAVPSKPAALRTPAPSTAGVRKGAPLTVRGGGGAHALAGDAPAAVELAAAAAPVRHPIRGPMDVLVRRGDDGTAELRHRHGGATIASLRKTPEGKWVASVNGKDLQPRDHQRTALMEAVGTWNGALTAAARRAEPPLQPPPQQTELMAEYGIPAMRSAAFATPTAGASDGPKVTKAAASAPDSDGDDDSGGGAGLSPKALAIYKKLKAKGFPEARAMAFAKNSEKFGKGGSG